MEKILVIGLALTSLLGTGVVGTMMTGHNTGMMGMMQGNYMRMGSGGCPMMNGTNISNIHEECEDHMNGHCGDMTSVNCKEMHEICEEHVRDCCEQVSGDSKEIRHGCPMMH